MSALVLGAVGLVLTVAVNVFSSLPKLPGPADVVRRHALWSIVLCEALAACFAAVALWKRNRHEGGERLREGAVELPPEWAVARAETDRVVRAVLNTRSSETVGITTGVHGAGGFGKTTTAQLVCQDKRIKRRFGHHVYWVTVGWGQRSPSQIAAAVARATVLITNNTTTLPEPQAAGAHLGSLLAEARVPVLLVLDDVWEASQLKPFLVGAPNCTRLVTTRSPQVLPEKALRVLVDRLEPTQAREVLTSGFRGLPEDLVVDLVEVCGRWALLLRLANRWIAEQATTDDDPVRHARTLLARLRTDPTATARPGALVDVENLEARNSLVQASMRASLDLLPADVRARFADLGALPADEPVPIPVLALLWGVRAGLDETAVRRTCADLERLALVGLDPSDGGAVLVHDVLHAYARQSLGHDGWQVAADLVAAVERAVPEAEILVSGEAAVRAAWWELEPGPAAQYLLSHAVNSLTAAGHAEQAVALASDLRFITRRIIQHGAASAIADLEELGRTGADQAWERAADLKRIASRLEGPENELDSTLLAYLGPLPQWQAQAEALARRPASYGRLLSVWPVPDQPDPEAPTIAEENLFSASPISRIRSTVRSVAISPDGAWVAAAGNEGLVKICDPTTGALTRTVAAGDRKVSAAAFSRNGAWAAIGEIDGTVGIWGLATGVLKHHLDGPGELVRAVAFSPDNFTLAIAYSSSMVRIQHAATGTLTQILAGHSSAVWVMQYSTDGRWLATGADDGVRIWDAATGTLHRTLTGRKSAVTAVAFSPDGTRIAAGYADREVEIWDLATTTLAQTLVAHNNTVAAMAFSPDGTHLATGGQDYSVRIWDRRGRCVAAIKLNASVTSLSWGDILVVGGRGLYGFRFAPAEQGSRAGTS